MIDQRMKYLLPLAEEVEIKGIDEMLELPYEEGLEAVFKAQNRRIMLWSDVKARSYFNSSNMFGGWYHAIGSDVPMGPFLTDTRAMEHALGIDE